MSSWTSLDGWGISWPGRKCCTAEAKGRYCLVDETNERKIVYVEAGEGEGEGEGEMAEEGAIELANSGALALAAV
jgi:hypothetical protein